MKKKILVILTLIVLVFSIGLMACNQDKPNEENKVENKTYSIVAPDGAPSLSIATFLNKGNSMKNGMVQGKVVAPAQIAAEAIKSDFAVVPSNLAANLYNQGKDIKVIASITNGNLYVISSKEGKVEDLNTLVGSIVYSIGKGSVPDMIFQTLLKNANVEYVVGDAPQEGKVVISYKDSGAEVIPMVMKAKNDGKTVYGVLGEPAIAGAIKNGLYDVYDLQKAWMSYTKSETVGFSQAVLIAKGEVAKNAKLVEEVLSLFKENEQYVKENTKAALALIKTNYESTSLPEMLPLTVVERCNIKTITVKENKEYLVKVLEAIKAINPKAIGDKMPANEFYYA